MEIFFEPGKEYALSIRSRRGGALVLFDCTATKYTLMLQLNKIKTVQVSDTTEDEQRTNVT